MGNAESVVVQKRLARFRPEERPVVEGVFDKLQGGAGGAAGKTITLEMLQSSVGSVAPGSMVRRVYRCMSSIDPGLAAPAASGKAGYAGPSGVSREQLIVFLADTLRGTAEERAPLVMAMSQHAAGAAAVVTCEQVVEFLQDLVSAVVQILVHRGRLQGWKPERMGDISLGVKLLAEQMCSELKPSDEGLPDGYSAPWRLVFSTQLHGESFTRMVAGLMKQGPTLLLIRDTKGQVFGGFASHTWEVKPQFQGDSRCFLFTVSPKLRVYTATGYNQHFMYLNQNQQTMPNGLGMGGQHGYFGLWLDSDFGRGHSRARPKCTTYGSPQLSGDEDFTLDSVEVWAVGKPAEPEEGEEGGVKKSILDVDPEAQALMEITGKTMHSQGLREPEDDQE
ncbi:MTOR-associated protein MEAK7 [Neolamprologus brichardi]|uniref:MTOR-associated protein MEAK7 n=1 Tax=Neolamprologus brichardi TaxID=32507 RepID=UPI0003EBC9C3|nr:MTOR-associated protein MEAK7 [Neolamprologus brichardi]